MSFGGTSAGRADLEFTATTGQAKTGIEELRRVVERETAGMTSAALRQKAAQEAADNALIRSHGKVTSSVLRTQATLRGLQEGNARTAAGADAAGSALRREGVEIERLGRGAAVGSGLVRGLGRAAAFSSTAFLGGAGLVYAIRTVTERAQEQTGILAALRLSVEDTGNSWGGYQSEIVSATAATARLSAFTQDDLYKSLSTLVRATGDVNQALKLNAEATDIARGSGKDLQTIAAAVAKAYDGQSGALRRLVPSIKAGVTGQQAIAEAGKQFAGQAQAYTRTAIGAQTSLTAAIHDTEIAVGDNLLPTVKRYELELAGWLGKSENQKRIQADVNTAVKDGTAIVHGLVGAEKLLAPPIHAVIGALGGLENAVEAAFVVGLALKAERAARAVGGIAGASARVRQAILADSAIEQGALRRTGAVATTTAAEESLALAGAAGGVTAAAAGGAGAGAVARGLLGRGASLITKGGELYLVYKGLSFALGSSPATSQSGPNRYQGSNLGADYSNFFGDLIHHPGRLAKDLGEGLLNDAGITHYGSAGVTGQAAPLYFGDVYPAIARGVLTRAALEKLKPRLSAQDYRALVLIMDEKTPRGITVPAGASGSGVQAGYLSPAQKRDRAVALHPNNLGALTAERDYYASAIAFLNKRQAEGKIGGTAYITQLKNLTSQEQGFESQIEQVEQAAATKRREAAAKALRVEKAAARAAAAAQSKLLHATLGDTGIGDVSGSFQASDELQSLIPGSRYGRRDGRPFLKGVPGRVSGSFAQSFSIPIRLQVAAARAATTAGQADDVRAAEAIRAWARSEIRSRHLQGSALIDALTSIASANATISAGVTKASSRGENEAQFLSSFQQIRTAYEPNAFTKATTHLYETVHELRRQTHILKDIHQSGRFPGTHGAQTAAQAAYG